MATWTHGMSSDRALTKAAGAGASTGPDAYYEHYWAPGGFHPTGSLHPGLEELYERHIPSGARVLDLGCGDGRTSGFWLRDQGCRYTGVDISKTALAQASESGLTVLPIGDASDLPFPAHTFDVVVCIEVLEHLFDPSAAVTEIARVLKPGGLAIVTTPNVAYWRWRLDLVILGRWNPLGDDRSISEPWRDPHIRFFTATTLTRMVEGSGLKPVALAGFQGAFIRDLPKLAGRGQVDATSRFYRAVERRRPSLLSVRLACVAQKRR